MNILCLGQAMIVIIFVDGHMYYTHLTLQTHCGHFRWEKLSFV